MYEVNPIVWLLLTILQLYSYIVLAYVIMSWLIAFNVINTHNRFVYLVNDFLNRATEPVLRPIRRFLPNLGGIDLSPIVLFLLIMFLQRLIVHYIA
ncbi:MAG: YggT family protein [Rhodospirillaceae bacterium]|jgi:YggT family protein|nr:YggT family protein [Rhodospirillaceae bacterium]